MDSFRGNIVKSTQICTPPCPASAMEPSFKLDEGYSEDTRSQEELDSQMIMDERAGDIMPLPMPLVQNLPDFVLALSEAERTGMTDHDKYTRFPTMS